MSDLMEIKGFIQRIAQGITFAMGIDTQVIDEELQRVAGTVYKPVPKNGGIIKAVMETGEYAISTQSVRNSAACIHCNLRQTCIETGYIHCPIVYNDKVVGVMGLICYESEQIEKVKDGHRSLLNFIQSMCELIELKLKEEGVPRKEQSPYRKTASQNQILCRGAGESSHENQITFAHILGESVQMKRLRAIARKIAKTLPNILLTGETGTGKEMFARAIHHASERRDHPFVTVNCAAIPMELLESELFGYEEGAFTGAKRGGKIGKFELANTGTILLDEIGDMPFGLQAKLLRVLQERKLERLGGNKQIDLNIRIISATNKELGKMAEEGKFREDLYYRLNIFELHLPPLRERPEDIPLLINYFIDKYRSLFGSPASEVRPEAMQYLCRYQWKGNIRELENVVQYMMAMREEGLSGEMGLAALPLQISKPRPAPVCVRLPDVVENGIKAIEMAQIKEAIKTYGSSTQGKKMAAKHLGISLATLYRRLSKI